MEAASASRAFPVLVNFDINLNDERCSLGVKRFVEKHGSQLKCIKFLIENWTPKNDSRLISVLKKEILAAANLSEAFEGLMGGVKPVVSTLLQLFASKYNTTSSIKLPSVAYLNLALDFMRIQKQTSAQIYIPHLNSLPDNSISALKDFASQRLAINYEFVFILPDSEHPLVSSSSALVTDSAPNLIIKQGKTMYAQLLPYKKKTFFA